MSSVKNCRIMATWAALLTGTALPLTNVPAATPHKGNGRAIHWGYSGDAGPSHWGDLTGKCALCRSGKRQSPVDIQEAEHREPYPLKFRYHGVPLQVINNGHTLQANYSDAAKHDSVTIGRKSYRLKSKPAYGSELMLGEVPYKLLQFQFHTPSEPKAIQKELS